MIIDSSGFKLKVVLKIHCLCFFLITGLRKDPTFLLNFQLILLQITLAVFLKGYVRFSTAKLQMLEDWAVDKK